MSEVKEVIKFVCTIIVLGALCLGLLSGLLGLFQERRK